MKLKLGFSTCPNDTFMFDALVNHRINHKFNDLEVYMADIEELNILAADSVPDVTKMSFHQFPFVSDEYMILNSGSALGFGNGPLLITKNPEAFASKNNPVIAIPGKNTTANLLLGILYEKPFSRKELLFSDIENAVLEEKVDAGVIIHENRFTYQNKGLMLVNDLGELWTKKTRNPIPLGCIAIRRSLPKKIIREFDLSLRKSIRFAFDNPGESEMFIRQHAQEMDDDVIRKHIGLYVNNFSEDLGEEGRKSIHNLFSEGIRRGIFSSVKEPIFVEINN